MELEGTPLIVITIISIGLVLGVGLFILGTFQTTVFTNSTDTSATQTILSESTATLTPIDTGITSSEVKAYNMTWLECNESGSDINIGNADMLNIQNSTSGFTILSWINVNEIPFSNGVIVSKSIQGDKVPYRFELNSGGRLLIQFYNGSWNIPSTYSETIGTDEWTFVATTYDGNDIKLMKQNVIETSEYSSYDTSLINTGDVKICEYGGQSWNINASVKSTSLYNSSLTAAQLNYIYANSGINNNKVIVPVILYHNLSETSETNQWNINISAFDEQMAWLNSSGFETITDIEYYNWTQDNGFVMPEKPIMISFDDGYISWLTIAAPNMSIYGYKGVAGITTNRTGTSDYMTWDNVSSLIDDYNWSIASHSVTHCLLANTCNTTADYLREFNESRNAIIGNTSFTPISFFFPGTNWDQASLDNCSQIYEYDLCVPLGSSFEYARYWFKDSNSSGGELSRIFLYNYTTIDEFQESLDFDLPSGINVGLYNINENNGTTAYDTSGNSNDGTISGATWGNDGILNTLTAITDYTISTTTGLFTIVNDDYTWAELLASWEYGAITDDTGYDSMSSIRSGLAGFADWIALIVIVVAASIVLSIVLFSFRGGKNV